MTMFIKHSSPVGNELLSHYRTIISQLLTVNNLSNLYSLRTMLMKFVSNIPASEKRSPTYTEFFRYLMVTHLLIMKSECSFHRMDGVEGKI